MHYFSMAILPKHIAFCGCVDVAVQEHEASTVSDEPVWRQVLMHLKKSTDPVVAQQAAAALGV